MNRKVDKLVAIRAKLGATLNVIDFARSNLSESCVAASATLSRIEEADYAQEMAALTKQQILQNAGMAISAQANAEFGRVLTLLIQSTDAS